jgi:hypothetical protein
MAIGTTDHDEIRKWAEANGGKPAAVDRTHRGNDVGIIRIMFPGNPQSEHQSLVEISWDEFFEQFEESKLALLRARSRSSGTAQPCLLRRAFWPLSDGSSRGSGGLIATVPDSLLAAGVLVRQHLETSGPWRPCGSVLPASPA